MKTRITRRKKNRSGKAKCQICLKREILVTHHIEGRDIPNANHPSNLIDICPNCHMATHSGEIIIEGWFQTSTGKELLWHKKNTDSITGQDKTPYLI